MVELIISTAGMQFFLKGFLKLGVQASISWAQEISTSENATNPRVINPLNWLA